MTTTDAHRPSTPILFAHWGEEGIRGSERVLLDLLAALDRARFAPLLWCNAETMASAARALDVPVRVDRMPILFGWNKPTGDVAGYAKLVRQARLLMQEHGARIVHVNAGAPNQWMVPVARTASIPLVAHLHGHYGLRDRCTMLLHQAPMIIGCSDSVLLPLRADGVPATRARVVHNGIDATRVNAGDARELRGQLGIDSKSFVVAVVGALIPLKGFAMAIRAIAQLVARDIDAHLLVIGDGPERDSLAQLASELGVRERCHMLGFQRHAGAILRDAASALAVTSTVEAFSLAAAEAGAVGRATVATAVGGIPEIVVHGETGIIVPPADDRALADALAILARDESLRARLGDAARARVLAGFTTERMARAVESIYGEMLSAPRARYGWSATDLLIRPFVRLARQGVARRLRSPSSRGS